MKEIMSSVLSDIGLGHCPSFIKDRIFLLALFCGFVAWIVIYFTVAPTFSVGQNSIVKILVMTLVFYPVVEEILFRGIIQGFLYERPWGGTKFSGFSTANWLTSLCFVAAHFWYHADLWSISVLFPSLVFGFFRDKYTNIYPSILLHVFYNAGFVFINVIAQ